MIEIEANTRPTRDTVLMGISMMYADRSTCDRLRVGAVIARDGRVLSPGYNGAPTGMPHCDHTCNDDGCSQMTHPSGVETVTHGLRCPASPGCPQAVHAEANAIVFAAKHGVSVSEAELFVTHSPCKACAMLIINAGISRVVFNALYRDTVPINFMIEAGITVDRV